MSLTWELIQEIGSTIDVFKARRVSVEEVYQECEKSISN